MATEQKKKQQFKKRKKGHQSVGVGLIDERMFLKKTDREVQLEAKVKRLEEENARLKAEVERLNDKIWYSVPRLNPSKVLPVELFVEIMCQIPPKEVARSCALVSKGWAEAIDGSTLLWKEFLLQDLQHSDSSTDSLPIAGGWDDRYAIVDKLEKEENGIEKSKEQLTAIKNDWKRYFVYKCGYSRWVWEAEKVGDGYSLTISSDRKMASLGPGKAAHANAWGDIELKKGVYKWQIQVDGLNDDGFWGALGIATEKQNFSYGQQGRFCGYSGAGDVFAADKELGQGTARRWKNGDIITIRVDRNKHTLEFWINGEKQETLKTREDPVYYPWANGYVSGCSFKLLH